MSEEREPLAYGRFRSRIEDASREGRLYSASSPQMIAIESDRLHRIFLDYKESLGDKKGWVQSVVGTVSLIVGFFGVAEFKDFVLTGEEWRGLLIGLIGVMIFLSAKEIVSSWKAVTLDDIIEELIQESNPVESNGRADATDLPNTSEIARRLLFTPHIQRDQDREPTP